MVSDLFL
jgi:hypothetical protein